MITLMKKWMNICQFKNLQCELMITLIKQKLWKMCAKHLKSEIFNHFFTHTFFGFTRFNNKLDLIQNIILKGFSFDIGNWVITFHKS